MNNINHQFKIYLFGDSICHGQGISIHKGWVANLSRRLSDQFSDGGYSILLSNCAINGNTTRLALERMPYDIQAHQPDILLVQFGMNDCNYWVSDSGVPRVSPPAFKANLQEIINRSKVFGVKKLFINTNHPTALDKSNLPNSSVTYQDSNRLYNSIIREVAFANQDYVELNDLEKIFFKLIDINKSNLNHLLLSDGLHLNEQGHDIYFNVIYTKLENYLLQYIPTKLADTHV